VAVRGVLGGHRVNLSFAANWVICACEGLEVELVLNSVVQEERSVSVCEGLNHQII